MKKWIMAEAGLVAVILVLGWLIKIQLTPIAQAKEVSQDEIFVQLADGRLVPYDQVKIVPIAQPLVKQALQSVAWRQQVYEQYDLYRKYGTGHKYLQRLASYDSDIRLAAAYTELDYDLARGLMGVESMGLSDAVSPEQAIGLTQIKSVPTSCQRQTKRILGITEIDPFNPQHNIWLGLLTLKQYQKERAGNLALGLVSYNYGPNRQTVKIATNLADLQASPQVKAYPIKVLALTLLAKVEATYGQALPYNQANKAKIEAIGLPGLDY